MFIPPSPSHILGNVTTLPSCYSPPTPRGLKQTQSLAALHSCLEATDISIFREVIGNIHKYAGTVSTYIDWCTSMWTLRGLSVYVLTRSPGLMRIHATKSETGAQLSSQETPGSTGRPDMSSREPSRLPREHPQRHESCYRETTPEACGRE